MGPDLHGIRIALVLNDAFSMWQFRKGLIRELVRRGADVTIFTPGGAYVERLVSLGARHVDIPFVREFAPFRDAVVVWRLFREFRSQHFDIVHTMTLKPNIFGVIAARLARVRRVCALIEGLGMMFTAGASDGWRWRVARVLYALTLRMTDRVWLMNRDDIQLLVAHAILPMKKVLLIEGTGIDADEYSSGQLDAGRRQALRVAMGAAGDATVALLLLSRLSFSKGVRQFAEAAHILRMRGVSIRCVLCGPLDPAAPDAVPQDYLDGLDDRDLAVRTGFVENARELIEASDIVVLPSYYREGIPRVLLEAQSMERPVVATDNVGCRDVVVDGVNGFLVPIGDATALADRLETLTVDPSLRVQFGRAGRARVLSRFADEIIVPKIISELYAL
jgi:N,N'-diacetylbacillosaminyl-diphospho-undecaprenol alpha-1,3-N-acetylgalactosaminyltransferase